jgi:hypothetical protein
MTTILCKAESTGFFLVLFKQVNTDCAFVIDMYIMLTIVDIHEISLIIILIGFFIEIYCNMSKGLFLM